MEFKSTTGKKVVINPADFADVWELKSQIGRVLSGSDFKVEIDQAKGMSDQDFDVAQIAKLALLVDSSREINDAVFKCLGKCTRDGERITMNTFDDFEAREDYYEIVIACLKVNLRPFFKALLSQLSPYMDTLAKATQSSPK